MKHDEGLAFYEHFEADKRTDLFLPRSTDKSQGTAHRLRNWDSYFLAIWIEKGWERYVYQRSQWRVTNPKTGLSVTCHLVDRGPSAHNRLVDLSDAAARVIEAKTDDEVTVDESTPYGMRFNYWPNLLHKS